MRTRISTSRPYLFTSAYMILALIGPGCITLDDTELELDSAELALEGDTTSVTVSVGAGGDGPGSGGSGGSTGVGGAGGGTGGGVPEPPSGPPALGLWKFDDCDPSSLQLADSSGNGLTATRTASATCAEGVNGMAVSFDGNHDAVEIPSQQAISFGQHVAVAAWVNPTVVSGNNPIIYQRAHGKTSFQLGIDNGNAVFKVTLATGQIVTTLAPVSAGDWTHIAGAYNGQFIFLFINGQQVGQIAAAGTLLNVNGPVRIGQSGVNARFDGLIDEVWLSNTQVNLADVQALSCIERPTTFTVSPATSGPVPLGTTVDYQIAVTNNNVGTCGQPLFVVSLASPPGFDVFVDNNFAEIPSGETFTFPVSVTSTDADPGVTTIPFGIFDVSGPELEFVEGSMTYEVIEPTGCFVRTGRELLVRHVSVVDDPIRTTFDAPQDPRAGAWTFGKLMENMAPTPADAPAFTEQLFSTWLTHQTVNGFIVPARPAINSLVLQSWPRLPGGSLDLTRAPLRLLAIVNRLDLRDLSAGRAGEGRFVFGVVDPSGFPTQFTVILEYNLPASTEQDVLDWANAWHALGSLPFPSEQYNAALQEITTRFTGRGADPSRPNGSALSQLRTNEIALTDPSQPWELREFTLSPTTGFLAPATVKLNPDLAFNGTQALADFVNANEASILQEKHTVPDTLGGSPFLAGSSLNDLNVAWAAPGISNNEARHRFSVNTCNGCHGLVETGTFFLHVNPRVQGQEAQLSPFMTGFTMPDPISGEPRTFNDLGRRRADLNAIVCGGGAALSAGSAPVSLAKGISRVH